MCVYLCVCVCVYLCMCVLIEVRQVWVNVRVFVCVCVCRQVWVNVCVWTKMRRVWVNVCVCVCLPSPQILPLLACMLQWEGIHCRVTAWLLPMKAWVENRRLLLMSDCRSCGTEMAAVRETVNMGVGGGGGGAGLEVGGWLRYCQKGVYTEIVEGPLPVLCFLSAASCHPNSLAV